jgi:serine/threonine protein kinase
VSVTSAVLKCDAATVDNVKTRARDARVTHIVGSKAIASDGAGEDGSAIAAAAAAAISSEDTIPFVRVCAAYSWDDAMPSTSSRVSSRMGDWECFVFGSNQTDVIVVLGSLAGGDDDAPKSEANGSRLVDGLRIGIVVGLVVLVVVVTILAWIQRQRRKKLMPSPSASSFERELQLQNVELASIDAMDGNNLLSKLKLSGRGGKRTAQLMNELARATMQQAESKFVIHYRQLVSAATVDEFKASIRELEVPRESILIGAELGRGQSGVVLRGRMSRLPILSTNRPFSATAASTTATSAVVGTAGASNTADSVLPTTVDVAVKVSVTSVGTAVGGGHVRPDLVLDEALLLEALLLNGLRHPRIVSLLAVVTHTCPVMLCTELFPNGDLRTFLRACRSSKSKHTRPAEVESIDMVGMAAHLAAALAFLERKQIIHRDVAARNVLVGSTAADVKLADLGAARNVFRQAGGVYLARTDHNPARWMSLEALSDAKFSHKSDVFAFGVLLWEILSFARTPWGAFGVADMVAALLSGQRLLPPEGAGPRTAGGFLYAIALRCWAKDASKRPPFRQLDDELDIHFRVLTSSTVVSPAQAMQVASGKGPSGEREPHTGVGLHPALDADGYVEESSAHVVNVAEVARASCPLPTLENSYAEDHTQLANGGRGEGDGPIQLDNDGYVEDQIQLDGGPPLADVCLYSTNAAPSSAPSLLDVVAANVPHSRPRVHVLVEEDPSGGSRL